VDAIISAAITAGVKSIDSLSRSELEVEKGLPPAPRTPPPAPKNVKKSSSKKKGSARPVVKPPVEVAQVVEKRQIILQMKLDQGSLQNFINTLASPGKMPHFTVIRVIRVENEKQEGPMIGATDEKTDKAAAAAAAHVPDAPVKIADAAAGITAPKVEVIRAATPDAYDAFAVLGQENLSAYFEIDLVRFVEPAAAEATAN
jgi:hypothetical protein